MGDVIYVTVGQVATSLLRSQFASFRVHTVALPLLGVSWANIRRLASRSRPEHFQGVLGLPSGIVPEMRPHLLTEAEQLWSVVLEYLTVAPGAAQFVLSHMRQDLRH